MSETYQVLLRKREIMWNMSQNESDSWSRLWASLSLWTRQTACVLSVSLLCLVWHVGDGPPGEEAGESASAAGRFIVHPRHRGPRRGRSGPRILALLLRRRPRRGRMVFHVFHVFLKEKSIKSHSLQTDDGNEVNVSLNALKWSIL